MPASRPASSPPIADGALLKPVLPSTILRCDPPVPPDPDQPSSEIAQGWVSVYEAGMVCYLRLESIRRILEEHGTR